MTPSDHSNVILFDGVCNLCSALVRFVITRDPEKRFTFAALQSESGRAILRHHGFDPDTMDAVVVVVDGHPFVGADGVLALVKAIGGFWKVLMVGKLLPRFFRNACYRLLAKSRYRLFGRKDACMVPTEDVSDRFL